MKKTWVRNTLIAILTLAVVLGVCGIAMAAVTSASINTPTKTNLAINETLTLTGSYVKGDTDLIKGTWTSDDESIITVMSSDDDSAVIKAIGPGSATITYSVDTNPPAATPAPANATVSLTVEPLTVTSPLSVTVLNSVDPKNAIQYAEGGAYTLAPKTSADGEIIQITSDNKIYGKKAGTAVVTVSTGAGNQTKELTVNVIRQTPTLSVVTPAGTSSTNPKKLNLSQNFTAEIATNSDGAISWISNNTTVASVSNVNAKTSTVNSVNASGSVATITVSTAETATYNAATVDFYVKVVSAADVFVEKTKVNVEVNGDAQIQYNTNGGGNATARSLNTDVATVSFVTNGEAGQLVIHGVATGTTTVVVSGEGTASEKTITVTVGNPTPTITLAFRPDVTKLGYGESTLMDITVQNPTLYSDGQYYAKIVRQNRRVYIEEGGSWRQSTYVYWVPLDSNGEATVRINPQYSGTVKVTVESAGATSQSRTFTVSGYPTLPQTGQDFTLIYVLGACCLVAAASWVIVYAKKKKNSTIA